MTHNEKKERKEFKKAKISPPPEPHRITTFDLKLALPPEPTRVKKTNPKEKSRDS